MIAGRQFTFYGSSLNFYLCFLLSRPFILDNAFLLDGVA